MADSYAPLVFINGSDSKSAQMFTLAHEIAHIWLGTTGVSDSEAVDQPVQEAENWCNRVAAELLVPLATLRTEFAPNSPLQSETKRLAGRFKVSTLVLLRRIFDLGKITRDQLREEYSNELARIEAISREKGAGGGNFYLTLPVRVSKRFARALVVSTLEGQTLYRDAFRMLGFSKQSTFSELGRTLGVA
jgi:Zn-dependent peptidase ImmA (M78 family)